MVELLAVAFFVFEVWLLGYIICQVVRGVAAFLKAVRS
jgi:hypothetical protein